MFSGLYSERRDFLVDGAIVSVRFDGAFENLARIPAEKALYHMMREHRNKKISIHLFRIRTVDLCALFVIWKDLAAVTKIHVEAGWNEDGDVEVIRANISVLVPMLRDPRVTVKHIRVNSFFMHQHFNVLFEDIVFDKVLLLLETACNGSDMPLCRYFTGNTASRLMHVTETDAFVPFVRKVDFTEANDNVDAFIHYDPWTLRIFASRGGSTFEQLAATCRNVEKLTLGWSYDANTNARCAAFLRQMPRVHTLSINLTDMQHYAMPEELISALAALPLLRRLRFFSLDAPNFNFLRRLPRIEKLRVNIRRTPMLLQR